MLRPQGRILRVILEMGSRADRRAILPEAFTPPSEADCVDSEEEMLATTPFALLSVGSVLLRPVHTLGHGREVILTPLGRFPGVLLLQLKH